MYATLIGVGMIERILQSSRLMKTVEKGEAGDLRVLTKMRSVEHDEERQ